MVVRATTVGLNALLVSAGLSAAPRTEVGLLDIAGVIVSVNDAWVDLRAPDGGDPARWGVGVSYLDACGSAGDEPVAMSVASAMKTALAAACRRVDGAGLL